MARMPVKTSTAAMLMTFIGAVSFRPTPAHKDSARVHNGETMTYQLSRAIALGVLATVLVAPSISRLSAQNRMTFPIVAQDSGHIGLGLALRRLNVSGTFMQAPAHPDDEHNALFAMFTLGMGLRSIDLQNNRGEGGQNEIRPELFGDMGVLR